MADIETTTDKEKSLFIIEDDKPFRERLTTSFQRKDFTVTAAANKKEALEILTGSDFNYAIVDLRLGDGSGLDVIKVIKEKILSVELLCLLVMVILLQQYHLLN